jgi:hypothetical protein
MVLPGLVTRQAYWEFDLALCLLESGSPDRAADSFAQVLKLVPDITVRPIVAYYLQKLGKPVPELPSKVVVKPPRATTTIDALLGSPSPAAAGVGKPPVQTLGGEKKKD